MFGKGEGGKISAEFTMTHPNIVTAGISHSWGFWVMRARVELEKVGAWSDALFFGEHAKRQRNTTGATLISSRHCAVPASHAIGI